MRQSSTYDETENCDSSTADIAPDGDVVLLVGPAKKRIRVYSLFLKNASTVFNAMLGPHFSEGQNLGGDLLTELSLPEDNAEAMTIICHLVHSRNDAIPETLGPDEIFQVAVAADKFDGIVPLAYAIKDWLNCAGVTDGSKLWRLLMAAYWFDNAKAFNEISHALVF